MCAVLQSCENDKDSNDETKKVGDSFEIQQPSDIIVAPNIATPEESILTPPEILNIDLAKETDNDINGMHVKVYMSEQSDDGVLDDIHTPELIEILTYKEFTEWLHERIIEMQKLDTDEEIGKRLLERVMNDTRVVVGFNIGDVVYIRELQQ